MDREKVIKGLEVCFDSSKECNGCPYITVPYCRTTLRNNIVALLKDQVNEYENGFNDAMLGKQKLMYEGTDGKWHKKDW